MFDDLMTDEESRPSQSFGSRIRDLWDKSGERFSIFPEDSPVTPYINKRFGLTNKTNPAEWLYEGAMGFVGSPRDLALTATTAGAGLAANVGKSVLSAIGRGAGRTIGAGYVARGADKAINEGDVTGGLIDAGVGALTHRGFKSPTTSAVKNIPLAPGTKVEKIGNKVIPKKVPDILNVNEGELIKPGLVANQSTLAPEIFSDTVKQARRAGVDTIKMADGTVIPTGKRAGFKNNPDATAFKSVKPGVNIETEPQTFPDAFSRWVNHRSASNAQAQIDYESVLKGIDDSHTKGIQAFSKIQSGNASPELEPLRKFFDDKYKLATDNGVKLNYQQDYIPQLWADSPDKVASTFKRLGLQPGFTKEKFFKSYEDGIKAGLTPRFDDVKDLVRFHSSAVDKAIADRKFFDWLKDSNQISLKSVAGSGQVKLDPNVFPFIRYETPKLGEQNRHWYTDIDTANSIQDYLKNPANGNSLQKFTQKVADVATTSKNLVANFGIPKTGINAHGFNVLVRDTMASDSPVSNLAKGIKYLVRPSVAEKDFQVLKGQAPFAIKNGLNLSADDFGARHSISAERKLHSVIPGDTKAEGYASNLLNKAEEIFSEPLFNRIVPTLKMQHWDKTYKELSKTMTTEAAAKQAAKITNNIYGGINTAEMVNRSKDMQNMLRAFLFAPDWAESNVRTGAGVVKSLLDPSNPAGKSYRNMAENAVKAYMLMNVTNKAATGRNLWENPEGYQLSVGTGKKDSKGKDIYVNPLGTAFDFARIPYDMIQQLGNGDSSKLGNPIVNRLSIPARTIGNQITGEDYFGNKLDTFGKRAAEASNLIVPNVGKNLFDFTQGDISPEQALTSSIELPIRYKAPKKSNFKF